LTAAVVAAAVLFFCPELYARQDSPPVRRFAVELQILAGDARVLTRPGLTASRRRGLQARIAGSLSSLRLLARQYLQAVDRRSPHLLDDVDALRQAHQAGRLKRLARGSAALVQRYPLDTHGLRAADATEQDRAAGRRIYRHLCMGCHAHPDPSRDNPAPDLFKMARQLPEREFIARLVGGVHGTPAVALHNPFTDAQLAGLAAFLTVRASHLH